MRSCELNGALRTNAYQRLAHVFLFDGGIPLAVSQKTNSAATTKSLLGTRSENHDRQSDECDEEARDNERGNVFHARLAYIGGVSRPSQRGHSKLLLDRRCCNRTYANTTRARNEKPQPAGAGAKSVAMCR